MTKRLAIPIMLVALLPGCGGNDKGEPVPAATRQELQKQLTSIEDRFEFGGGACADISQNQASVERTLDSLPADVDADARKTLSDGFARLFELTGEQCDDKTETETETEPTPSAPPPTTTREEETPTAPPETEEQPPQDGGDDKGKGKSKGNDGDGGGGALQVPGDGSGGAAPPGNDG